MNTMVFIGGVHGVGKTFFSNRLFNEYKISTYSASQLIKQKSNEEIALDKKVSNIPDNQNLLLDAIRELELQEDYFFLDGHFCLINKEGRVERIPESTFFDLQPKGIIVLVDSVEKILEKKNRRDGKSNFKSDFVNNFQKEELNYSREIANKLNIPYLVHNIANSLEKIDEFLKGLIAK